MFEPYNDELDAKMLYQQDISSIKRITRDERQSLVDRARSGDDDAIRELALSLLPIVFAYAMRMQNQIITPMDLIGVGNLTVIIHLKEALQMEETVGFLLQYVKCEMYAYIHKYLSGPITLPSAPSTDTSNYTYVDLFDKKIFESDLYAIDGGRPEYEADMTPLYAALDALSIEASKTLIIRLFGLNSTAPESPLEIAGGSRETKEYTSVMNRRTRAIKIMKDHLLHHYPDFVARHAWMSDDRNSGLAYSNLYDWVKIPASSRKKLDTAFALLTEKGEKLSMNKLRQVSGVHTTHASAYFYEIRKREAIQ